MPTDDDETHRQPGREAEEDAVAAARQAVRDLYEQGMIDDNHATAALLAIDLGRDRVRRARATAGPSEPQADPAAGRTDT